MRSESVGPAYTQEKLTQGYECLIGGLFHSAHEYLPRAQKKVRHRKCSINICQWVPRLVGWKTEWTNECPKRPTQAAPTLWAPARSPGAGGGFRWQLRRHWAREQQPRILATPRQKRLRHYFLTLSNSGRKSEGHSTHTWTDVLKLCKSSIFFFFKEE